MINESIAGRIKRLLKPKRERQYDIYKQAQQGQHDDVKLPVKKLNEVSPEKLQVYVPKAVDSLHAAIYDKDRASPTQTKIRSKRTSGLVRAAARQRGEPVLSFKAQSKMAVN